MPDIEPVPNQNSSQSNVPINDHFSEKNLRTISMIAGISIIAAVILGSYPFIIQYQQRSTRPLEQKKQTNYDTRNTSPTYTFPAYSEPTKSTKSPGAVLKLDPTLYPLPPFPRSVDESYPAYYVDLSGAKNLTIKDTSGKMYMPFFFDELDKPLIELNPTDYARVAPTAMLVLEKLEGITTYRTGDHSVDLIFDSDLEYSLSFTSSSDLPVLLELEYGTGDRTELKIVYHDLLLDGSEAWFTVSPRGVTQIRTNDKLITPHAVVTGTQANDKDGPEVALSTREHDGRTEITLTATDNMSTVTKIMYSLNDLNYNEYSKPFFINTGQTKVIHAFAEDTAGNRSPLYSLPIK